MAQHNNYGALGSLTRDEFEKALEKKNNFKGKLLTKQDKVS